MTPTPYVPPAVFVILAGLVEERAGLRYEERDRELFLGKAAVRAYDRGFESLLDYYYYLRYDDPAGLELDRLVEHLVVHESYLFREYHALRTLVEHDLAPRAARTRRKLRVWSAACAAGEEPFTLAMLLADRGLLDRVEVIGTDISAAVVERARRAELGPRALRDSAEPSLVQRFVRRVDGRPTIDPTIRTAVQFRRCNLLDATAVAALGSFDAILCRNVLIYFSEATTRAVIERLASALVPDGTLWVGVSESLLRVGTRSLACEEHDGVFFYRRVHP